MHPLQQQQRFTGFCIDQVIAFVNTAKIKKKRKEKGERERGCIQKSDHMDIVNPRKTSVE
jgi:hypothetical protein